ncbi:hypothetical protein T02_13643 [Trichinella nativa]|uniref:Uncharacterized protein n=1 Tax=Trichinella nativa TaxID=6335 RepID=A0A0V1L118_9BILA|nr:hypothetical protein T02_13643 [Trichinella nativa]
MLMLREIKLTKPADYQIRMNKKQNYIWARYKCSCEKQASKMLFRVGSSRCIALVVVVARRKVYSTLCLYSEFTLINDKDVQSLGDVCPVVEEQWASKVSTLPSNECKINPLMDCKNNAKLPAKSSGFCADGKLPNQIGFNIHSSATYLSAFGCDI